MNVTLDEEMKKLVEEAARKEIVATLLKENDSLRLVSPAQAAGILDVTPRVLAEMPIPRVDLAGNGRTLRYRLTDLNDYIEGQVIK